MRSSRLAIRALQPKKTAKAKKSATTSAGQVGRRHLPSTSPPTPPAKDPQRGGPHDDPTPRPARRRPGVNDRAPRPRRRHRSPPAFGSASRATTSREVPDFQRHVLTLDGPVGCNTRSCHGSFQGQGGLPALALRLRLQGRPRDLDEGTGPGGSTWLDAGASKILAKPTLAMPHKGGKRFEVDGWQYRLIERWIEGGAKGVEKASHFDRLEVTPERRSSSRRPARRLRSRSSPTGRDGGSEDVTCLTRFRTNDESIAEVDEDGVDHLGRPRRHPRRRLLRQRRVQAVPVLRPVSALTGDKYPAVPTADEGRRAGRRQAEEAGDHRPSPTCNDAEFLRRVGLDLAGTLPTARRDRGVPLRPLARQAGQEGRGAARPARPTSPGGPPSSATTRATPPRSSSPAGRHAGPPRQWYDWIYKRVAENMPYDKIVAGLVLATSRPKGESYDDFVKDSWPRTSRARPEVRRPRDDAPLLGPAELPQARGAGDRLQLRLPRRPARMCPVPQAPVRPVDPGRLQPLRRLLQRRRLRSRPRRPRELPEDQQGNRPRQAPGGERNRKLQQLRQAGEVAPWQEVFVNRNGQAARVAGAKQTPKDRAGRVVSAKVLGGEEVASPGSTTPGPR